MAGRRRGLRLAEVLAVAAMVGIGILARPAFHREILNWEPPGCEGDCISNLNQIAKASLMYAADYDGHLPQTWFDGDGNGRYTPHAGNVVDGASDYAWAYGLFHYTKSFQIFTCKQFPSDQNWDGRIAPGSDEHGISYGMNSRLGEVAWHLPRVSFPAQTVLAFDVTAYLKEPWAGLPDGGNSPYFSSLGNVAFRVRDNHAGRTGGWLVGESRFAVVGYCDGHVRAQRIETLLRTGNGPEGNLWDPVR